MTAGAETTYTITPFQEGIHDPSDIARLHRELREWQEANGQNTFADISDSQPDLNAISAYYIEPGGNFFVAESAAATAIMGFVGIKRDDTELGSLKRLAVVPEHQGLGVGHDLVGEAVGWSRASGFSKLKLATGESEKARSIYEKFGFKIVGYIPPNKDTNGDWLMELDLS